MFLNFAIYLTLLHDLKIFYVFIIALLRTRRFKITSNTRFLYLRKVERHRVSNYKEKFDITSLNLLIYGIKHFSQNFSILLINVI